MRGGVSCLVLAFDVNDVEPLRSAIRISMVVEDVYLILDHNVPTLSNSFRKVSKSLTSIIQFLI